MPNALFRDPTTQLPADFSAGFLAPPGYIDGCEVFWNSGNGLSCNPGSAYIPSLGYAINVPSAVSLTGIVTAAGTWHHVYLYLSGMSPAIECVTTAPASYSGSSGWTKTGDTSRRYLGSVYSTGTNTIAVFLQTGNSVEWLTSAVSLVSAGTNSASYTAGSINVISAGAAPVTARTITMRVVNLASSGAIGISNADTGLTIPAGLRIMGAANNGYLDIPISQNTSPGAIQYCYTTTPVGANATISATSYTFSR